MEIPGTRVEIAARAEGGCRRRTLHKRVPRRASVASAAFLVPAIIGAALALVPGTAAGALIRADATLHWTENLSRTSAIANQRDAYGADVHGSAAWARQIHPGVLAGWHVDGSLHATPKYELREHGVLGIGADLRYKFGLGPTAPTLAATASTATRIARLDQDNGWTSELRIRGEKRITTAWRAAASMDWTRHNADSATFDVSHRRLAAEISWDATDRWRLSHGQSRLEGNFTANAGPAAWAQAIGGQVSPAIQRYYTSLPWEVTGIYGPGWVTYNVTGRVRSWWLEISPALTERSSLALRYEQLSARNIVGIEYDQTVWSLSLAHQF